MPWVLLPSLEQRTHPEDAGCVAAGAGARHGGNDGVRRVRLEARAAKIAIALKRFAALRLEPCPQLARAEANCKELFAPEFPLDANFFSVTLSIPT